MQQMPSICSRGCIGFDGISERLDHESTFPENTTFLRGVSCNETQILGAELAFDGTPSHHCASHTAFEHLSSQSLQLH